MTATVSALCGEGMETGCALVSRSRYASLAGVPLAALGLAFYASLAVLALLCLVAATDTARRLAGAAFGLVALALAADLALLGLQAFAIGAYCRLCLATYAVNAALLAALWPALAALASATRMPQDPDREDRAVGMGRGQRPRPRRSDRRRRLPRGARGGRGAEAARGPGGGAVAGGERNALRSAGRRSRGHAGRRDRDRSRLPAG
jgi:uncharacterized membrane protein